MQPGADSARARPQIRLRHVAWFGEQHGDNTSNSSPRVIATVRKLQPC